LTRKNAFIEAHAGTLSRGADPYDLGKIKVFVSKELYQVSYGIQGFLRLLVVR